MGTMKDFSAAIPAYLMSLDGKSQHTIAQKRQVIEKFQSFMESWAEEEITPAGILAFRHSFCDGVFSSNTIAKYMAVLAGVFLWLDKTGIWTGENPVRKGFVPRERYKEYEKLLEPDDLLKLMREERPKGMPQRVYLRDRALVWLLLTSGLRCSEALSLTIDDFDLGKKVIRVRNGKGGKQRTVGLESIELDAIQTYMREARPAGTPSTAPIFVQHCSESVWKPLSRRTAIHNTESFVEAVTGKPGFSPHTLRHSYASFLLTRGMPMPEIQTLLGHVQITTTQRYAQLLNPDTTPANSAGRIFSTMLCSANS